MKEVRWPVISFKLRRTNVTHSYSSVNVYNTLFVKESGMYFPIVQPSLAPADEFHLLPIKRGYNPVTVKIYGRPDNHFKLVRGRSARSFSVERPFVAPYRYFEIIGVDKDYQRILALYLARLFGVPMEDALSHLSLKYENPKILEIMIRSVSPTTIMNAGENGVFTRDVTGAGVSFYVDGDRLRVKSV